jgi:hypothetical protein
MRSSIFARRKFTRLAGRDGGAKPAADAGKQRLANGLAVFDGWSIDREKVV